VDGDGVTFNDPYPPKGGKAIRVSREGFRKMVDDIGTLMGMSPSFLLVANHRQAGKPEFPARV